MQDMWRRHKNEEVLKKKNSLKALLKKVVREVIVNSNWLDTDGIDDQKISANAKRNIALLVRTKKKIGMLTTVDKSLIRTPPELRTVANQKKLCVLFEGLRCFSCLPPKLRACLVPVTKFMSLNAGRTIIRQGDHPITIFFIISGEVEEISQLENTTRGELIYGPGDCIGDVEIFEDCSRGHSFITTTHCELLVVFDDDFISILKPFMGKIWNEKKRAIRALDYFDFLNESQFLTACKLSTLKQFKPLDTIYSQDEGTLSNVYFVLSGECVILQCLFLRVDKIKGKKYYKLVDGLEEDNFTAKSDNNPETKKNNTDLEHSDLKTKQSQEKMTLKDIQIRCAMLETPKKSHLTLRPATQESSFNETYSKYGESYYVQEEFLWDDEFSSDSSSISFLLDKEKRISALLDKEKRISIPIASDSDKETRISALLDKEKRISISIASDSGRSSIGSEILAFSPSTSARSSISTHSHKYESRFIDVGSLTFGGVFGLGERIEHRMIMARNTVQCLVIPRFFLLEENQNPGKIWQRRIFYLDCTIPSREELFKDFLKTLNWKQFKSDFIRKQLRVDCKDVARDDDIPILCRIEEEGQ